jgi:hypothetical protein
VSVNLAYNITELHRLEKAKEEWECIRDEAKEYEEKKGKPKDGVSLDMIKIELDYIDS